ncbi:MAG: hypothetical protein ACO268_09975 [Opitutales bacterium]
MDRVMKEVLPQLAPSLQVALLAGWRPYAGETGRVVVRDGTGALVERTAADAGALLRSLEPLEPAFARRFAAAHPFAAGWSTSTAAAITVTVGFFTTLWLPHGDAALEAANAPALDALRTALTALARRRGGRIVAPTMG